MKYPFDVLGGVYSYINSKLATALSQIASARSITIETPAEIVKYASKLKQGLIVEVAPGVIRKEYISEIDVPVETWYHSIPVFVTHHGTDIAAVADTLLHYVEAVDRIIRLDSTFGALFERVRISNVEPNLLIEAAKSGEMTMTLAMTLEVMT
jgi:hypothetical protein